MTPKEFASVVSNFRTGAHPGKNIYLWCGALPALLNEVGMEGVERMSILDLPSIKPVTFGGEAMQLLHSCLELWLEEVVKRNHKYSIAVINELAMLAYYEVGLEPVFLHHANDKRMTVLCLELGPEITHQLPPLVEYDSLSIERFFRRSIPPTHIIKED